MNTFLTLIQTKVKKSSKEWLHQYRCICGRDVFLPSYKVNSLHTKSCGCKRNGVVKGTNQRHGISNHPLFGVWYNMIRRCYSPDATKYKNYGARGVRVCDEWRNNFKLFFDWAIANGWKKGMQIDKDTIPKKIGIAALLYSPETCQILTNKENCNARSTNRMIEYNGSVKTVSQWADTIGIHQGVMRIRIDKWGIEKALNTPIGNGHSRKIVCVTTGEQFPSVFAAYKSKKVSKKKMYAVLRGEIDNVGGLLFKYLN